MQKKSFSRERIEILGGKRKVVYNTRQKNKGQKR